MPQIAFAGNNGKGTTSSAGIKDIKRLKSIPGSAHEFLYLDKWLNISHFGFPIGFTGNR